MFNKRTIFIVGAGGSRELGFPLGSELSREIQDSVNFKKEGEERRDPRRVLAALRQHTRENREELRVYLQAGAAISQSMPHAPSIDNYLHTHRQDPHLVHVGKLAIAASILNHEHDCDLRCYDKRNQQVDFREVKASWLTVFCKLIFEMSDSERPDDMFENVSFITFNYDRCIEHYIEQAVRSYFRLTVQSAQNLASKLEVMHPYGKVGRLPWQKEDGPSIEFGSDEADLNVVARQLRTFTEGVGDEAAHGLIRQRIAEAEMVVYLGFSFGDINMDILSLKDVAPNRVVIGTTKGVSPSDREKIKSVILGSMGPSSVVNRLDLPDVTCQELLEQYSRHIRG